MEVKYLVQFGNIIEKIIRLVAEELYCSNLFIESNEYDDINKLSNDIDSKIEFWVNVVWIVYSRF